MNKKGVVSVGAKFHAQYTAEALEKKGMLKQFYVGKKLKSTIIPKERLSIVAFPLSVGFVLRKLPFIGSKIPYNIVSDILFDFLVSRKINQVDFLIGFNNYSLNQMKKLKEKGAVIFLEQRIAHVNTELEIYMKEMGSIPSNLSKPMIKRKLLEYELADYILVPSRFVWNSMVEHGVPEKKLLLIPYGYNKNLFYKIDNKVDLISGNSKSLNLLFVGQIGYRKGVKYILEAVWSLVNQGYSLNLTLVGNVDSNFKGYLKKYKGIYNHIEFMPQKDLLQVYNNSDLFIFPSLCEGSALVTYEALACGLPLLVTENAGSVVTHEHDGVIVKPFDSIEIENALIDLINNPQKLNAMKLNALETAKKFTWEKYGENLTKAINDILQNDINKNGKEEKNN